LIFFVNRRRVEWPGDSSPNHNHGDTEDRRRLLMTLKATLDKKRAVSPDLTGTGWFRFTL